MSVSSWSDSSVAFTISDGASSGLLGIAVAPSMNESNTTYFEVTANPLPAGWLHRDVIPTDSHTHGPSTVAFTNNTFTASSNAEGIGGTSDAFTFIYQPLGGDGTIVAQVSETCGSAGLMIRETLDPASSQVFNNESYYPVLGSRLSAGASYSAINSPIAGGWIRLTRAGSTVSGYISTDGVYWSQIGSPVTTSMVPNVFVGLAMTGYGNANCSATFGNVSFNPGTVTQIPNITAISPAVAGPGWAVTITGTNFGASQGAGAVYFNQIPATSITSWSDTQIVAVVPPAAVTGYITVVANGLGSNNSPQLTIYNPVPTSLTPPAAPVGGTVTLAGSGFGTVASGDAIQIGGTPVPVSAGNWSDTSITFTVPANVSTGPVQVIKQGITSSSVGFTLLKPTVISSVTPNAAASGTVVTVSGAGFGAQQNTSSMSFNGQTATVVSWSDQQVQLLVEDNAQTGPIYVAVASLVTPGPTFTRTSGANLTDSLQHQTTYSFVLAGGEWRTLSVQGPGCSSCTERGNISFTYDTSGDMLSRTNENNQTTTYTYDAQGDVLTSTQPLSGSASATTTYTYNSLGEVLTAKDPLNNVTTNTYDSKGNLLTVTSPAPGGGGAASVTQFAYDAKGELTQITDPLNNVTTLAYTSTGLIQTITDAQQNVTTYGYDNRGNRTSVTDAQNNQTTFAYDLMNRLTSITYPGGTTTSFAYDIRGRRTSMTDQNNNVTQYTYDDADRLVAVKDANQNSTTYGYDTENNLTNFCLSSSGTPIGGSCDHRRERPCDTVRVQPARMGHHDDIPVHDDGDLHLRFSRESAHEKGP